VSLRHLSDGVQLVVEWDEDACAFGEVFDSDSCTLVFCWGLVRDHECSIEFHEREIYGGGLNPHLIDYLGMYSKLSCK